MAIVLPKNTRADYVHKSGINNYLIPMVILLVGIILTVVILQLIRNYENDKSRLEFEHLVNQTVDTIQHRMKANTQVLRGAAGMFYVNHLMGRAVSRAEFKTFIASLKLEERYPGMQGVGFSQLIRPDQLGNHLRTIRAEGFPDYALRPSGERKLYSSIVYLEPFDWRNQRAFGYDMYSDPVRRRAMERARKTGEAALSSRVTLVQENNKDIQAGVLMYLPVYRVSGTPTDEQHRLDELIGWVYSPLRMKDLMSNLIERDLPSATGRVSISIYDGKSADPADLLFSTEEGLPDQKSPFHSSRQLEISGQPWYLTASALPRAEGIMMTRLVLAAGVSISLLLSFISLMQIRNTARLAAATDQLREANGRLSLAQKDAHAGFWDWDVNSDNLVWTPEFFLLFGLDPATTEANFNTWCSALHPEDLQAAKEKFADAIRDHTMLRNEYRIVWTTGEVRWIYASGNTTYDHQGQLLRMSGICIDITELKQTETLLLQSRAELQEAQRIAHVGSWHLDLATNAIDWTEELYLMQGLNPKLAPPDYMENEKLFTPESWTRLNSAIASTVTSGAPYEVELEMVRPDGSHGWMLARGEAVRNVSGATVAVRGVALDITGRKMAEDNLRITASVFHNSQEAIMITNESNTIIDVNPAFTRITGYGYDEVIGKNPKILSSGKHAKDFYTNLWASLERDNSWRGEIWNRRKSGEIYPEMLSISALRDSEGRVIRHVAVFSDISNIKKHEAELVQVAYFDALTGIPNRLLLADRMKQAISQSEREQFMMAVCYLDLDGFKPVNDVLGHQAGDRVLIEIASRIGGTIRGGDTVARLGGDEFVILLLGLSTREECVVTLERLLESIAEPISISNSSASVSASIGVCIYSADEQDPDTLLRHADQAMYVAKQSGKNRFQIYDVALD